MNNDTIHRQSDLIETLRQENNRLLDTISEYQGVEQDLEWANCMLEKYLVRGRFMRFLLGTYWQRVADEFRG